MANAKTVNVAQPGIAQSVNNLIPVTATIPEMATPKKIKL
jgi:hypothetical protein